MFLCRNCLKLSKAAKPNENHVQICPKCRAPVTQAPTGTAPLLQSESSDSSFNQLLPAGFGGVAFFEDGTFQTDDGRAVGKMLLAYAHPLDIPGTNYCTVLPGQDKVKRSIVDEKCRLLLEGKAKGEYPMVAVRKNTKNNMDDEPSRSGFRLIIAEDHHHTFVAALRSQVPIWLYLLRNRAVDDIPDWTYCRYVDKF